MAKVTQKTLKLIQKLKAKVIKLLDAKASDPRTEEENAIYRRVLQEAEKDERDILAILKKADSRQLKAVAQKCPSMKSKGKSYRKLNGESGKK